GPSDARTSSHEHGWCIGRRSGFGYCKAFPFCVFMCSNMSFPRLVLPELDKALDLGPPFGCAEARRELHSELVHPEVRLRDTAVAAPISEVDVPGKRRLVAGDSAAPRVDAKCRRHSFRKMAPRVP